MPKLTDTQLVILSAAANRDDGAVLPLTKSLKVRGAALIKVLNSLCRKGFLEEKPAGRTATSWRESEDGRSMMLVITEVGLQAIDGEPAGKPEKRSTPAKTQAKKSNGRVGRKPASAKSKSKTSPPTIRPGSKQAQIIDLLKRKSGATIDEIVGATGWQAHSVRGAISGTLKKKLGLAVSSEKVDGGGRVYRIATCG